jgi:glycosyltransferase involved in cell wall biosynthesis
MNIGIMVRTIEERQGIGLYTLNLLDNLFRIDTQNNYYLFYKNLNFWDRYKQPNVHQVLVKVPSKLLWDQVSMPFMVKKYKLDILFNTKFTVPLLTSCPSAMVMHGSEWYIFPQNYTYLDIKYVKFFMPLYLKKAKMTISVSDRAKFDMVKYAKGDPEKFRTIYLAYNDRFSVIKDKEILQATKDKYDLPDKFILFVGKIYPGKNIDTLVKAFSKIADKVPHKLLLVGGFRWKYDIVFQLIEQLGLKDKIVFKEWVAPEELPAFYNLADVFAFPSIYESCPAPPWEAMACGCPVVTTDTGGTPEVVGDAALYVKPDNPDMIGDALFRAITDEKTRLDLIQKGFNQIKKFSWEKTAVETLEVFEKIYSENQNSK